MTDGDSKVLELIDGPDWEDNGKYSNAYYVFKFEDKYYGISDSRTGSYYTDYYYHSEDWSPEEECEEVKKIEKITHEWFPV